MQPKREVDYSGLIENRKSETITVRLTPGGKAELVRLAKADKRKPTQLAAIIIGEWLETRAKKSAKKK